MVRLTFKILQQMILNLIMNSEYAGFLQCVWPFWSIRDQNDKFI